MVLLVPVVRSLAIICSAWATCGEAGPVRARDDVPAGYVAAPYYPTPHGGWIEAWADAYSKAQALVEQMTLAEKTNITAGSGLYMGK